MLMLSVKNTFYNWLEKYKNLYLVPLSWFLVLLIYYLPLIPWHYCSIFLYQRILNIISIHPYTKIKASI